MLNPSRLLLPAFLVAATGCLSPDDAADDELAPTATSAAALTRTFETAPNAPTCQPPHIVAAAPGEEGQWAAVRVGTTRIPFRPDRVTFRLRGSEGGSWCSGAGESYRVRIFHGPATGGPPATPVQVGERLVSGVSVPPGGQTITIGVRSTVIPAKRAIYVAIEMAGDVATDSGYNCVAGCGPQIPGTSWWSLATGAPYGWVTLGSLGGSFATFDLGIKLEGDDA